MVSEKDSFVRLPDPPPVSPEVRRAAIARAMEHFERLHGREPAAAPSVRRAPAAPWRLSFGAPRMRYLVAACLAVFIVAPVAWMQVAQRQPGEAPADMRHAQEMRREQARAPSIARPPAKKQEVMPTETQVADSSPPAPSPPPAAPSTATPEARAPAAPAGSSAPSAAPMTAVPTPPAARPGARPASPTRSTDWEACNGDDLDRRISGCTRLIDGRAEDAQGRAAAHLQRGIAHTRKGDLDRALADFDQSIRLDPNNAAAYFNRSLAWRAKGDVARADADRAQAIGLDAGYASR